MREESSEEPKYPVGSRDDTQADESLAGVSPYATGGGGVTFERKVAVQYLAHLLVGDSAVEFGEGRRAVSVAFQQAPDHPVDDLVVCAARPGELAPSWETALGIRRSPKLVLSDESTRKLIRQFVQAVIGAPTDDIERRLGLVVAGPQTHAQQLGILVPVPYVFDKYKKWVSLVYDPIRRTYEDMPALKYKVELNESERTHLKEIASRGETSARKVKRALVLLKPESTEGHRWTA